jgi:hypothetical protein
VVADVLRRQERPLGQGTVELPGGDQAGDRLDVEAGEPVDPLVHLPQLGHPLGGQGHGPGALAVGPAGVALVLAAKLVGHDPPHLVLFRRVLDVGDGVAAVVGPAHLGDHRAPRPVGGIGESGVVLRQLERRHSIGLGARHDAHRLPAHQGVQRVKKMPDISDSRPLVSRQIGGSEAGGPRYV